MYPPLLSLYATNLSAEVSLKGMFDMYSTLEPISPSGIYLDSTSKLLADSPITGLFVIILTTPACELAPNKVPCGPDRTSIRLTSAA